MEIDNNNRQLLKKLDNVSSYYSTKEIKKSIKNYSRLKTNLVNSRMDPFYDLGNYQKSNEV